MKLLVSIDEHYISDGVNIYTTQGTTTYNFFWTEYLQVFEQVYILARLREDRAFAGRKEAIANGPNVEFIPVPDFKGPSQYWTVRKQVLACIREAIPRADAYFLRGPGIIGGFVAAELERQGKPYATQVIGDPWEVFGAGNVGGALRPVYRHLLSRDLKRICKKSLGVSYVTRSTLQRRYPAAVEAISTSWSDVQIGGSLASEEQMQARLARQTTVGRRPVRLGFIGSLEQPYKGADVLLKAVAACQAKGVELEVEFAGDGKLRAAYEWLATELGIANSVKFLGRLGAGKPIFDFLDSIDIFVMPSLTEGLPRAMIEAMARGCPCIGSRVGGIPELLDDSGLVKAGDATALAEKIMGKIALPAELREEARRNHAIAEKYLPEHAQALRFAFLHAVRNRFMLGSKVRPKGATA